VDSVSFSDLEVCSDEDDTMGRIGLFLCMLLFLSVLEIKDKNLVHGTLPAPPEDER